MYESESCLIAGEFRGHHKQPLTNGTQTIVRPSVWFLSSGDLSIPRMIYTLQIQKYPPSKLNFKASSRIVLATSNYLFAWLRLTQMRQEEIEEKKKKKMTKMCSSLIFESDQDIY